MNYIIFIIIKSVSFGSIYSFCVSTKTFTLPITFDWLLTHNGFYISQLYFFWQDLSLSTTKFDLLTLEFDLLFTKKIPHFNLGLNFWTYGARIKSVLKFTASKMNCYWEICKEKVGKWKFEKFCDRHTHLCNTVHPFITTICKCVWSKVTTIVFVTLDY